VTTPDLDASVRPGPPADTCQRGGPAPAQFRLRRGHWWLLVALAVVVVLGAAGLVATRGTSSNGSWTPLWQDDFSGASGTEPSSTNWSMSTGTSYPGGAAQWGTGEQETYTRDPANVALDGSGHLRITATRDASGAWRSARLETNRTDFQAPAGGQLRVEAKIKTPDGGAGYWPAFWMLGAPFRGVYTNWPGIGEVDIMENSGGVPATVHGTLHCGVNPGGPCNETNGLSEKYNAGTALSGGFHTYAVVWDRSHPTEEIRWYVDDHLYSTVRSSQMDAATWAKATHHGFFVLLNLAIGGSFPGPTDAQTRPGASMLVDSVSVSRR
jgi:beta-glucanase (GH16 family)